MGHRQLAEQRRNAGGLPEAAARTAFAKLPAVIDVQVPDLTRQPRATTVELAPDDQPSPGPVREGDMQHGMEAATSP